MPSSVRNLLQASEDLFLERRILSVHKLVGGLQSKQLVPAADVFCLNLVIDRKRSEAAAL